MHFQFSFVLFVYSTEKGNFISFILRYALSRLRLNVAKIQFVLNNSYIPFVTCNTRVFIVKCTTRLDCMQGTYISKYKINGYKQHVDVHPKINVPLSCCFQVQILHAIIFILLISFYTK